MELALKEARKAFDKGEVPVGAVLVGREGLIARGHNLCEKERDATSHAELLVLRRAAQKRGRWGLEGTTLYVTLEPCLMCVGALSLTRVSRLVFGCRDPKAGAVNSLFRAYREAGRKPRLGVTEGIQKEACLRLLHSFFRMLRQGGDPPLEREG